MFQQLLFIPLCFLAISGYSQMVLSAEGILPENACKPKQVYFLITDRAKPVEAIDSIEIRLNHSIDFAKENKHFTSEAALQMVVNCKGENGGGVHIVTSSGSEELDKQLTEFFKTVKSWKAGKIKKKQVDSWYMWRIEISNGFIDIIN